MDWAWLLFSFKGRIQRLYWWVTNLVVSIAAGVAGSIIEAVARAQGMGAMNPETNTFEPTGLLGVLLALIGLINLWILYALGAKRLHDRDRAGWWLVAPLLSLAAAIALGFAALSLPEGHREPWNALAVFATLGTGGLFLWLLLELGFLPGTEGPNRFGADPGSNPK